MVLTRDKSLKTGSTYILFQRLRFEEVPVRGIRLCLFCPMKGNQPEVRLAVTGIISGIDDQGPSCVSGA